MKSVSEKKSRGHRTSKIVKSNRSYSDGHLPYHCSFSNLADTSAGTGKLCILGHLGLVFIWSCFVSCLLFLLFYVSLRNLCSGTCRKIQLSARARCMTWHGVACGFACAVRMRRNN